MERKLKLKLREILTSEEISKLTEKEVIKIYYIYSKHGNKVVSALQRYARNENRRFMALRWLDDDYSRK